MWWIDALKTIASHLIVWHHLAFYGPMSQHARPLAPEVIDGLARYGRWAVPVFLVIAGYLVARGLPLGQSLSVPQVARLAGRRYLRLVGPLVVVLAAAVAANLLAQSWMVHRSVTPVAGPWDAGLMVLAHVLLLQDLLGVPSLSAGLWYVSIDWQLYVLGLAILALAGALPQTSRADAAVAGVALLVMASLFFFNRRTAWDVTGLYFFAAYGLGMLVGWSATHRVCRWALLLVAVAWAGALVVDWRVRLVVAAATAAVLAGAQVWMLQSRPTLPGGGLPAAPVLAKAWAWGGRHSYALFLAHFPVCLVVNAGFERWMPHTPGVQALGLLLAWAASILAAVGLHRVETR